MLGLRQFDEALALARRGLALGPNQPEALYTLGLALVAKGDFEEGVAKLRRVAELRPDSAAVHASLGRALMRVGDFHAAIAHLSTAQARDPSLHQAQLALGMALLSEGRFSDGWRHYEARLLHREHIARIRLFSKPRWHGQEFKDKTLLLHAEQGLGDTIQLLRYLPMVAARGGNVLLELQPELVRLAAAAVQRLPVRIVSRGATLPPYDFNCPLMSLPLIFSTRLESIPATIPYISLPTPPPDKSTRRRIGIAWAAGASIDGAIKSLHLADFSFLSSLRDIELFSLQKGMREQEVERPPPGMTISRLALRDFLETAAVVANLDLVISIDTAVAHLAGALGKPVWVLLPEPADWRWLTKRETSPWYPTMRLIRQQQRGDWTGPLDRVAAAVREWRETGA